jgi:hypothetical protein
MEYVFYIYIIVVVIFFLHSVLKDSGFFPSNFFRRAETKFQSREIMKVLLGLDEKSLNDLFELYKNQFGRGAARYARKTYQKWKDGEVRPNERTYQRFLIHLPKVMSYDLKCEVLRHLMEEYCARDDWEKTLAPLVKQIIDKSYTAELPPEIEEKLRWLADGEMQIAQDILRKSQAEEGKIAVSMLRQEFANIENLIENTNRKSKVTHKLELPYGTINLNIKRR